MHDSSASKQLVSSNWCLVVLAFLIFSINYTFCSRISEIKQKQVYKTKGGVENICFSLFFAFSWWFYSYFSANGQFSGHSLYYIYWLQHVTLVPLLHVASWLFHEDSSCIPRCKPWVELACCYFRAQKQWELSAAWACWSFCRCTVQSHCTGCGRHPGWANGVRRKMNKQ